MKGISLPINMIVIIAIAVLVLVVIAAFFTAQIGGGTANIALTEAFSRGCAIYKTTYNCANEQFIVTGYSTPGTTTPATFLQVCQQQVGGAPAGGNIINECRRQCGCPSTTIFP